MHICRNVRLPFFNFQRSHLGTSIVECVPCNCSAADQCSLSPAGLQHGLFYVTPSPGRQSVHAPMEINANPVQLRL